MEAGIWPTRLGLSSVAWAHSNVTNTVGRQVSGGPARQQSSRLASAIPVRAVLHERPVVRTYWKRSWRKWASWRIWCTIDTQILHEALILHQKRLRSIVLRSEYQHW